MNRILITGAAGSVGTALAQHYNSLYQQYHVTRTDIDDLDITDRDDVLGYCLEQQFDLIYHLAGAKHAPDGELDPAHVSRVNIDGTLNILHGADKIGAKVVTASTCKACDPETAYGATKLIAERATLNHGGVVVRFHNIPESQGNVFRLWESVPADQPLPVTNCWRYFTPMKKAVQLLLEAAYMPSGRYIVPPGDPRWMPQVAADLYPGRATEMIPARRGDRAREPAYAQCEQAHQFGPYLQIVGAHDPVAALQTAA